jgi:hypothetical protein
MVSSDDTQLEAEVVDGATQPTNPLPPITPRPHTPTNNPQTHQTQNRHTPTQQPSPKHTQKHWQDLEEGRWEKRVCSLL